MWQALWCRTVTFERFFYPHQTAMIDSFSWTPLLFSLLLITFLMGEINQHIEIRSNIFFAVAVICTELLCKHKTCGTVDFCFDLCQQKVLKFHCFEDVNLPDWLFICCGTIKIERFTNFFETRRCCNICVARNRSDLCMNFICTMPG